VRDLQNCWQPTVRASNEFNVRSLFSWDQHSPKGLTDLVYGLKGIEDSQAWLEIALWMIRKFSFRLERPVFVPVPGTRPNHAYGLAAALSRVMGHPVQDALVKVNSRRQKDLGREERRNVRFVLRSGHLCTDYRSVIIVDDVVTTGATAMAAYQALLRPKHCEVWCLMDRQPCGH